MSESSQQTESHDGAHSPERQGETQHAVDIHTTPMDNPNAQRRKRGRPSKQKQPATPTEEEENGGDDDGDGYGGDQSGSESQGTLTGSEDEEPVEEEAAETAPPRRPSKGASTTRKSKANTNMERRTRRGTNARISGGKGIEAREGDGGAGGSFHPNEDREVGVPHQHINPDRATIPQGELLFPLVTPAGVERTSPAFITRIQQPSFQAGLRLMLEGSGHIRECRAAPWDHVNNCICNLDPAKSRRKASVIVSETDLMMFPRRQFDEFVHRAGLERPSYSEYMRFLREQWLSSEYTDRRLPDHTCELGRGRLTEFRQLMSTAGLTANGVRFLKEERDRSMNRRHQHAHRERTKVVPSDRSGPASPRSARARSSDGGNRSNGNGVAQQGPGYQGMGAPPAYGPYSGGLPAYPFGGMMPFNVPGMYPPLGMAMDAPPLGPQGQQPPFGAGPAGSGQPTGGSMSSSTGGPAPSPSAGANQGGANHPMSANPIAPVAAGFQGVSPGASAGGYGGANGGMLTSPADGGMGPSAASGANPATPQGGPLGFPRVPWDQYLALQAIQMQLLGGARTGGPMMNMMGGLSASPAQIQQLITTLQQQQQQQQQQMSGQGSNGHLHASMGPGGYARSSSPNAVHTPNELDAARHLSSMFNKNTVPDH